MSSTVQLSDVVQPCPLASIMQQTMACDTQYFHAVLQRCNLKAWLFAKMCMLHSEVCTSILRSGMISESLILQHQPVRLSMIFPFCDLNSQSCPVSSQSPLRTPPCCAQRERQPLELWRSLGDKSRGTTPSFYITPLSVPIVVEGIHLSHSRLVDLHLLHLVGRATALRAAFVGASTEGGLGGSLHLCLRGLQRHSNSPFVHKTSAGTASGAMPSVKSFDTPSQRADPVMGALPLNKVGRLSRTASYGLRQQGRTAKSLVAAANRPPLTIRSCADSGRDPGQVCQPWQGLAPATGGRARQHCAVLQGKLAGSPAQGCDHSELWQV